MQSSEEINSGILLNWARKLIIGPELYSKSEYLYKKKNTVYAVMVVDMQKEFLKYLRPGLRDYIIENQIKVLRHSAENNVPVLAVEFAEKGKTMDSIYEEIIKNSQNDFITKKHENAFKTISVLDKLYSWKVTDIFLMGINASACVKHTAMGAKKHRFNVTTTIDVIGDDFDMEKKDMSKTLNWFYYEDMLKDDLENSVLKSLRNDFPVNNFTAHNFIAYSSQMS